MTRKLFSRSFLALSLTLGSAALAPAVTPTDQAVQTSLQQELSKKFKDVYVTVGDRVATLNGTIDRYLDKLSAEKTAKKYEALKKVVDRIQVAGPAVADQELFERLSKELSGDRALQGNVFDDFYLQVKDGVVTLSGYAHNYPSRDSALGIIAGQTGIKDVVDKVTVLPLSNFDNSIRLAAARSIYGNPGMQKYALDPVHPIRIVVNNGNVILAGTVLNPMDKELAEMAALHVPGVFSVTNNLRVERDSRDTRSAD